MSLVALLNERFWGCLKSHATTPLLEDSFDTGDIATLLWAFANLNLAHGELFRRVRLLLEQQATSPCIVTDRGADG